MNRIAIPLLAAALALAACQPKSGPTSAAGSGAADTSKVLATVNGTPITQNFFEEYIKAVTGKGSSELPADQRAQALDNLIRARVLADQGSKEGTDKDAQTRALIELSRLNVLQQAQSERYLKDKPATEQESRAEYESQVSALPKQEYHARHILVATQSFAQKLIGELEKGGNFAEIAKRESMDASKTNGGDLGWFTPDRMVKPVADAVIALKPGQYTHTPVQTQYGWHIIRLEEERDVAAPLFDTVKQRLDQVVQAKKIKNYVDELMKTAKIERTADAVPATPAPAAPASGNAASAPSGTPPAQ